MRRVVALGVIALFALGCGDGSISEEDGVDAATDTSGSDEVAVDTYVSSDTIRDTIEDTTTTETTPSTDTAVSPDTAPPPSPICLGKDAGSYCGNDEMKDADPSTLYECPGAGKPPTSWKKCDAGCFVAPAGSPDYCKTPVSPGGYRLPWPKGTSMSLTQDCNDSCCGDHVGVDQWAWDFANGGAFTVVAARGGTVTHLKINSTSGCGSSTCANDANLIVIDHGDGTQALYMHLQGSSLKAGVTCGATVTSGQALATAGTTGWSTGIHLHFQVEKVHSGAPTCECGADGKGCSASTVPWANLWCSATYPTIPIDFTEWPTASKCANRRITMPAAL